MNVIHGHHRLSSRVILLWHFRKLFTYEDTFWHRVIFSYHAMFELHWTRFFFLNTICSLCFWHTCDLETRSRSSNLVFLGRPHQSYNHAKFERSPLNSVQEKANIKGLFVFKWEDICQLSPLNMCDFFFF